MGEISCTIDTTYARYNCGPKGDGSTPPISSYNSWNNSNEGTETNPSLGIYAGYAAWNDREDNPEGNFNWRSVIRFTVPTNMPKNVRIDEVTVCLPLMGYDSTGYPYHSYAILSEKVPYSRSNTNGVRPGDLCSSSSIVVNSSGDKRDLDCTLNSNIALCTQDDKAYAHILKDGVYSRPTGKIDSTTNMYYRFNPSSLTPGGTYYLYFVRQGKCSSTTGCVRSGGNGHGASGYVHLRVRKNNGAFVKIKYTDSVKFTLTGSLDSGRAITDFSAYGSADFDVGTYIGQGESYYSNYVAPGTGFRITDVVANTGYKFMGTLPDEVKITSSMTYNLPFRTNYSLTFVGASSRESRNKLKSEEFVMPHYEELFGNAPTGQHFVGWKSSDVRYANFLFNGGVGYNQEIDRLITKIFFADFEPIKYKINYMVDGVVVKSQSVSYNTSFIISDIEDSIMRGAERRFMGWLYEGESFTSGVYPYAHDITVEANFERLNYTLEFVCNGDVLSTVSVEYGSDVSKVLPTEMPSGSLDSTYQKVDGWKLRKSKFTTDWSILSLPGNCINGVITITATIGPRYKIIVYRNGGWKLVTPIVSCETMQNELEWHVIYPRIDKE